MTAVSDVAAVVIGRNEGERLSACLAALSGRFARIVYVDSRSVDDSVARARDAGAEIVVLDAETPVTAARGRNAGAAAVARDDPNGDVRYIQFIDGDCVLEAGWVETARAHLEDHPDAAVACGRRRERAPGASIYNRLCDIEWNTPIGRAEACGGDAMMRRSAFETVGGFDPTLIAGEEPDLCRRLRAQGWSVWRLDAPMTIHDAAIARFGQWWRRMIRSGWAYADATARHGGAPNERRAMRSILLWGGAAPTVAILGAIFAFATPAALFLPATVAALYAAMIARITLGRRRAGDAPRVALAYGIIAMTCKPAQMIGALRRLAEARRSASPSLIEYKASSPTR